MASTLGVVTAMSCAFMAITACGVHGVDHAAERRTSAHPDGAVSRGWRVSRVIDGDTVEVRRGGSELTLRLIGIDTPETVHPTEPVECYGPEASAFAKRILAGRRVLLEFDQSQGRLDDYGRTLAYLWLAGGRVRLFNLIAVRRGYALEYTYDSAYQWQGMFLRAQQRARAQRLGVWRCPAPGS
jgi:micrococcal nuclease